jgi:NTP pyrophosphatase (non-canonical NTP hydrolase)
MAIHIINIQGFGVTMAEETTLSQIQQQLMNFNLQRNWDQYHSPRNLAMALSVEVGELLALYLWSSDDGPQPPVETRLDKVEEEVADVLICLLNFCQKAEIDILSVTEKKILKNGKKYPVEKSFGKLEKHTEL